jgi:hypothetical protein
MYQWKERVRTEKDKQLGGKVVERKVYTYDKEWSANVIDSSDFKEMTGHRNPGRMPYTSEEFTAPEVLLGAFVLGNEFVGQLDKSEPLELEGAAVQGLASEVAGQAKVGSTELYLGDNPSTPTVGDVRIRYEVVKPAQVTVVGQQAKGRVEPYQAEGMDSSIALLEYGSLTAPQMFTSAEESNAVLTWVLRVVGFVVMLVGLLFMTKPLSVFADVVPFLGSIVETGTFLVSLLVALPLSLVTMAVAWLFYRPLLAVGLLVVAGGAITAVVMLTRRHKQEKAPARPTRRAA